MQIPTIQTETPPPGKLRLLDVATVEALAALLRDPAISIYPIAEQFADYSITADSLAPVGSGWTALQLAGDSWVWRIGEHKRKLHWRVLGHPPTQTRHTDLLADGNHATLQLDGATAEANIFLNLPLMFLRQDDQFVYWGFRPISGESGRNRWFGRARSTTERRTPEQMRRHQQRLLTALTEQFGGAACLLADHNHPGEEATDAQRTPWLVMDRIPLPELYQPTDARALKTRLLATLLRSVVVGEKLTDESQQQGESASPPLPTNPSVTMSEARKNQILYGPPGTGKTFQSVAYAVAIADGLPPQAVMEEGNTDAGRRAVKRRFDTYREQGQIAFVTFHQAFSYEDFVEGIKPKTDQITGELTYTIEAGVFKLMCARAFASANWQYQLRTIRQDPAAPPDSETLHAAYLAHVQRDMEEKGEYLMKTKSGTPIEVIKEYNGALHVRHKAKKITFSILKSKLLLLDATYASVQEIQNVVNDIESVIGPANASAYWAVLDDFKQFKSTQASLESNRLERPAVEPNYALDDSLTTQGADFNFWKLDPADYAEGRRFVLIIDEINRGNIANIFGELITLLEEDKRAGRPEATTVRLPYSKLPFSVPDNLYLLGTMNTADRSVEALDTALRRRFSFTEMLPKPELLPADVAGIDLRKLLTAVNARLEQLLDHDHCLGHALLLSAKDFNGLREAFQRNILPLLQEYFFGDWGKIGLVLGEAFVEQVNSKKNGAFPLKPFKGYVVQELSEKPVYRLVVPTDIAAFEAIYEA